MKKVNKILAIVLCLIFVLSLYGCNNTSTSNGNSKKVDLQVLSEDENGYTTYLLKRKDLIKYGIPEEFTTKEWASYILEGIGTFKEGTKDENWEMEVRFSGDLLDNYEANYRLTNNYLEIGKKYGDMLELRDEGSHPRGYGFDDDSVFDNVTIEFGKYYINNDTDLEPIKWYVIKNDKEKKELTLLSKYVLDHISYEGTDFIEGNWEKTELRMVDFANDYFYNTAFSEDEKDVIQSVTKEHNDYFDKRENYNVFLLSGNDVEKFLVEEGLVQKHKDSKPEKKMLVNYALFMSGRKAKATDYAKNKILDYTYFDKLTKEYLPITAKLEVDESGFAPWWMWKDGSGNIEDASSKKELKFKHILTSDEAPIMKADGQRHYQEKNGYGIGFRPAIVIGYYTDLK